jgi:hypothetical protein
MDSINTIQLFWVVIFFFSVIILFFVWAKSMVIMRLFANIQELLNKMDTLYDEPPALEK